MLYVILIVILLAFVSVSNFIASRNMERESDAIVHDCHSDFKHSEQPA